MTGIPPALGWVMVAAGAIGLLLALTMFAITIGRALTRADREEETYDDDR